MIGQGAEIKTLAGAQLSWNMHSKYCPPNVPESLQ